MPTIYRPNTQEEAIEATFQQRMNAITASVKNYHQSLVSFVTQMTKHEQDAENIVQELWKHVLLKFDLKAVGDLPLLRFKARQLFLDYYRQKKRRSEMLTDQTPESASDSSYIPYDEDDLRQKERFWRDFSHVDLTEQQKEVMWLSGWYGFTYKEIEKRTGISSSTVGDWITSARAKLAEAARSGGFRTCYCVQPRWLSPVLSFIHGLEDEFKQQERRKQRAAEAVGKSWRWKLMRFVYDAVEEVRRSRTRR